MRILVLSDSHSSLHFMRKCIGILKPDCLIHLGDYFQDGAVIAEENPGVLFYQVPGNCDAYRCPVDAPEVRIVNVGGVWLYLTHGHRHQVKSLLGRLIRSARESGAAAALYGHTHIPDCHREEDGLWVINPGSCGYFGGTAALMTIQDRQIRSCQILRETDLEEYE